MTWYQSPRWSGEILDCSMPMTFDTYSLCSYNCLYCFALFQVPSRRTRADAVASVNPDAVKKLFRGETVSQFTKMVQARRVMQWGGMSDGFDDTERERGVSLDLLRFFKSIRYPLSISTKGAWITEDDRYREVLRGADFWHFKVSIINWDAGRAARMEGGVASPQARVKALRELQARCWRRYASVAPSHPRAHRQGRRMEAAPGGRPGCRCRLRFHGVLLP